MAFLKKPFRKFKEGGAIEGDEYIDLGELTFEDEGALLGGAAASYVRVAEVYRFEDIGNLTNHLYEGNFLIVDYNSIANDQLALKRITNELKSVTRDLGGDVAAIGKNMLMATPAGIRIDRTKIKGSY